ncbi:TetR/AcrR family transcriptional regulator [Herbiconiux sp. YIM B11900]|uniref:TetR/AcrR family transcriptional regulator n=1 Tax=Herbiconiux sp. YIM B11900 TaxID=3404131 RepID=UPI003F851021
MPVTERRSRLLAAAFDVIAVHGVAGATTRAVVEAAGMKLASFHYAFASREELLAELVAEVVDGQQVVLEVTSGSGSSLEAVLELGLRSYFAQVRADPLRERAMFELTQYSIRTPGMRELAARQYERYRSLAEESLAEAAQRTGAEWRRPLPDLAADLVVLTDGITLAWLADGDDERADRSIRFAARALAAEAEPRAEAETETETVPGIRPAGHHEPHRPPREGSHDRRA